MKHRDAGLRNAAARWLAGLALLTVWTLAGCSSPLHQAPSRPQAEAGQNQVQLSWGEAPGAESYTITWANSGSAGDPLPNEITGITTTSYLHTGLTNFKTYRYRIYAVKGSKSSPGSVEVSAEPGPTPNSVEWATATVSGSDQVIYFGTAAGATAYRIYYSTDPTLLTGRFPPASYFTTTTSPYTRTGAATSVYYYRVMAMSSVRPALDGPLIVVPLFGLADTTLPAVAPALGDQDADNCLDLVVAKGNCGGVFTALTLADAGLGGLVATGRVNGDSRIADFNGDGKADIFTSTAARADSAASRAILHVNQGSNKFVEDSGIAAKAIGGFSGTVLAADFNNDGSIDIFVPNDSSQADGGRNWLLMNSGSAVFVDRAQEAGLRSMPVGAEYVPHGGQAADINEDGRVDILVGSQLFINNGDGTFTDRAADYKLPVRADRGLRLVDVDMDGRLDLIQHDGQVLRLYRNVAGKFDAGAVIDGSGTSYGYGLAACDVNGDGFEDVVVANNSASTNTGTPRLLINVNGELRPSALPVKTTLTPNDLISCGDLDNNGRADIVAREGTVVAAMPSAGTALGFIRIRVLGATGLRNQQGHIVKIVPAAYPARTITRVIDGGSGLMSQGDYDVVAGTQWAGNYTVSVRFKGGVVSATTTPGSSLTIYEDGRVSTKLD